jgi:hypothetical protein
VGDGPRAVHVLAAGVAADEVLEVTVTVIVEDGDGDVVLSIVVHVEEPVDLPNVGDVEVVPRIERVRDRRGRVRVAHLLDIDRARRIVRVGRSPGARPRAGTP